MNRYIKKIKKLFLHNKKIVTPASREKIMNRLQEHYDFICGKGYEVVCTCLQGSQNYGLDEYSAEYCSDIDSKSIVLPKLEDYVKGNSPISKVLILENNEHAEIKDIRVMFEMFKKSNLSYIELLYSKFIIINPKWRALIEPLFANRDLVSSYNRNQFIKCIAGMAYEKRKALCHPYPATAYKIEEYGYDGKQLSHCARLYDFIKRYSEGEPISACYTAKNRDLLMNYKKERDAKGLRLECYEAISLCDYYVGKIKDYKEKMVSDQDTFCQEAKDLLDNIQFKILKVKLKDDLRDEKRGWWFLKGKRKRI